MYSSSSLRDRLLIRVMYELLAIYIFTISYASFSVESIKTVLLALSIVSITIFIVDIIIFIGTALLKKVIRKIRNMLKKK